MHKLAIMAASAAAFCLAACSSVPSAPPPAAVQSQAPRALHADPDEAGFGAPQVSPAVPLLNWTWGNPQPKGGLFRAAAIGLVGSQLTTVAVGGDGLAYASTDGVHWTQGNTGLPIGVSLYSIAWGASRGFVATGLGFHYAPTGVRPWGYFFITSDDGIHWSDLYESDANYPVDRIAYGDGIYVAVLREALVLGKDDWYGTPYRIGCDPSSPTCSQVFTQLVFGNHRFVALGQDRSNGASILYASADGAKWSAAKITLPPPGTAYLYGVAWNGKVFVAVGTGGDCTTACGLVYTSTDGLNWSAQAKQGGSDGFGGIAAGYDGTLYAISDGPEHGSAAQVYNTKDGVAWNTGQQLQGPLPYLRSVVALPGRGFVAGTTAVPATLVTSQDFASWDPQRLGTGPSLRVNTVVYANKQFFAMGPGMLVKSADAQSWTQVSVSDAYADLCWNGSFYVAVGPVGTYASYDGTGWKPLSASPIGATGIACSGQQLVQVARGGGVLTSSDGGLKWQAGFSKTSNDLAGVATNGSLFVAAAGIEGQTDGTTLLTSADGTLWTKVQGLSSPDHALMFSHIRWTGGKFMAAGAEYPVDRSGKTTGGPSASVLAISGDGSNWQISRSSFRTFGDVAAVGGAIYTTPVDTAIVLFASLDGGANMGVMDRTMPYLYGISGVATDGSRLVVSTRSGALAWAYSGQPIANPTTMKVKQGGGGGDEQLTGSPGVGYAGDGLVFTVKDPPAHGTVTISPTGMALYSPFDGYTGQDSFTFRVQDWSLSLLFSEPATVDITVFAGKPVKERASHP